MEDQTACLLLREKAVVTAGAVLLLPVGGTVKAEWMDPVPSVGSVLEGSKTNSSRDTVKT